MNRINPIIIIYMLPFKLVDVGPTCFQNTSPIFGSKSKLSVCQIYVGSRDNVLCRLMMHGTSTIPDAI